MTKKPTEPKQASNSSKPKTAFCGRARIWCSFKQWFRASNWHRALTLLLAVMMLWVGGMYGVAQWYIYTQRKQPISLGATFISGYADYLGVDPHETLHAIITDLGVKHLRLVSYWDAIEQTPGAYDFSDLDWQFKMAEQSGVKVSLALGLRQPRWPECHMPDWAKTQPQDKWYAELQTFIGKVIEHYHSSPALESYQLENEYFLKLFGMCTDFNRDRLVSEARLVKALDPEHELIISRSNNGIGLPLGAPTPDVFGVSVYKRVWDKTVTKRYFEYPLPAWFYASLAGGGLLVTGKDLIIHELQAEAWTPPGYNIVDAPISELYKSMNPDRLHDRFAYAQATGMKQIDLWGVEWWYQMKVNRGSPDLWNTAKAEYQKNKATNNKLSYQK